MAGPKRWALLRINEYNISVTLFMSTMWSDFYPGFWSLHRDT